MPADVFISYSREDKSRVADLAQKLRDAGVSLWIDQGGIDAAALWSEEIVNALENARVLLLIISEKAVISHNVLKELTIASERKGHILPVHLEPTKIPATMKYALAGIQHIEYFQGDPGENLKAIVRSLERLGVPVSPPKVQPAILASGGPLPGVAAPSIHDLEEPIEGNALAVLPFENMANSQDADYFSDGLTEELIASLSNIKEIEVISRRTSMKYKGTDKDDRIIGRELGARYLAGGSVRKIGENLRITAQLVDADKGKQLWANTYKGKLDDIFDIQEQLANQIAEALKLKLSLTEKVSLGKRPTVNAQAYDFYLRGKDYLYHLTKRSVEYSIQLFEKAFELDPRYAAAYAACSNAYGLLFTWFSRDDRYKDRAQELGLKALMYDNESADAYSSLSLSYLIRHEYEEAISAGKKAITLDPDSFLPYWIVGRVHFSMGNFSEAKQLLSESLRMQPNFYSNVGDLEMTYSALGEETLAEKMRIQLNEMLPTYLLRFPDDGRAHMVYAINLSKFGHPDGAKEEAKKALDLSPGDPLMLYNCSCFYAQLGETQLAVQTLKDAIAVGHENFDWMKQDPDLDPIRNDPEYIELMKDK